MRLFYYQYQVLVKPNPRNIKRIYLDSLKALGIDLRAHEVRFVEDDWFNYMLVSSIFDPRKKSTINLPNERSGLMMVFRTFDHVSYGLIIESTRVIYKHDAVTNPR